MPKRKFEQPQPGNPYQLPIKQHVFPVASIARFTNPNGGVSLYRIPNNQIRRAKPTDDIFCAKRAWDARAETGYMKKIEDDFQDIAARIIEGSIATVGRREKFQIDQFFALWKWRGIYRDKELEDIKFNGLTGDNLTKDQEEVLEKKGILYVREGGLAPAHRMHGIQIQGGIMHEMRLLPNVNWAIMEAHQGQFIVPDLISTTFVPLTPTLSLCGTRDDVHERIAIPKFDVIKINQHLRANSKEYYFANDLGQCFI